MKRRRRPEASFQHQPNRSPERRIAFNDNLQGRPAAFESSEPSEPELIVLILVPKSKDLSANGANGREFFYMRKLRERRGSCRPRATPNPVFWPAVRTWHASKVAIGHPAELPLRVHQNTQHLPPPAAARKLANCAAPDAVGCRGAQWSFRSSPPGVPGSIQCRGPLQANPTREAPRSTTRHQRTPEFSPASRPGPHRKTHSQVVVN